MGASMNTGGGGGGRKIYYRPNAEINVTPFVDVVLVLLIIFMVSAPLMTVGVNVTLPDVQAQPLAQDNEPLVVSRTADGRIYVQELEVTLTDLAEKTAAVAGANRDTVILIQADQNLGWLQVMEVLGALYQAGFQKLAFKTNPER